MPRSFNRVLIPQLPAKERSIEALPDILTGPLADLLDTQIRRHRTTDRCQQNNGPRQNLNTYLNKVDRVLNAEFNFQISRLF